MLAMQSAPPALMHIMQYQSNSQQQQQQQSFSMQSHFPQPAPPPPVRTVPPHQQFLSLDRSHSSLPDDGGSPTSQEDRKPWTKEEDEKIRRLVHEHGTKKWSVVGNFLPGRSGKQCRERWHNHLNPDLRKAGWSYEEDMVIIECHRKMGSRWSEMAKKLEGRTDNAIKNRWNSTMRRVARQQSQTRGGSGAIKKKKNNANTDVLFQYCSSLIALNPDALVSLPPALPKKKKDDSDTTPAKSKPAAAASGGKGKGKGKGGKGMSIPPPLHVPGSDASPAPSGSMKRKRKADATNLSSANTVSPGQSGTPGSASKQSKKVAKGAGAGKRAGASNSNSNTTSNTPVKGRKRTGLDDTKSSDSMNSLVIGNLNQSGIMPRRSPRNSNISNVSGLSTSTPARPGKRARADSKQSTPMMDDINGMGGRYVTPKLFSFDGLQVLDDGAPGTPTTLTTPRINVPSLSTPMNGGGALISPASALKHELGQGLQSPSHHLMNGSNTFSFSPSHHPDYRMLGMGMTGMLPPTPVGGLMSSEDGMTSEGTSDTLMTPSGSGGYGMGMGSSIPSAMLPFSPLANSSGRRPTPSNHNAAGPAKRTRSTPTNGAQQDPNSSSAAGNGSVAQSIGDTSFSHGGGQSMQAGNTSGHVSDGNGNALGGDAMSEEDRVSKRLRFSFSPSNAMGTRRQQQMQQQQQQQTPMQSRQGDHSSHELMLAPSPSIQSYQGSPPPAQHLMGQLAAQSGIRPQHQVQQQQQQGQKWPAQDSRQQRAPSRFSFDVASSSNAVDGITTPRPISSTPTAQNADLMNTPSGGASGVWYGTRGSAKHTGNSAVSSPPEQSPSVMGPPALPSLSTPLNQSQHSHMSGGSGHAHQHGGSSMVVGYANTALPSPSTDLFSGGLSSTSHQMMLGFSAPSPAGSSGGLGGLTDATFPDLGLNIGLNMNMNLSMGPPPSPFGAGLGSAPLQSPSAFLS